MRGLAVIDGSCLCRDYIILLEDKFLLNWHRWKIVTGFAPVLQDLKERILILQIEVTYEIYAELMDSIPERDVVLSFAPGFRCRPGKQCIVYQHGA